jgi:hypothetical protein
MTGSAKLARAVLQNRVGTARTACLRRRRAVDREARARRRLERRSQQFRNANIKKFAALTEPGSGAGAGARRTIVGVIARRPERGTRSELG